MYPFIDAWCLLVLRVPFHHVRNSPSTLHLRKHSFFRHLCYVYHTCSKAGRKMTHLNPWPQFMCSLHRFTRKKNIFRSNKRLRHCNPTIVSLSLEFSVDCFDETARSAPDWHLQSADSKSPACFNLACLNKVQTFRVTKERTPPSQSGPNWWCLSFRPTGQDSITGCWGCSNKHEEQFSSLSFLVAQTWPPGIHR